MFSFCSLFGALQTLHFKIPGCQPSSLLFSFANTFISHYISLVKFLKIRVNTERECWIHITCNTLNFPWCAEKTGVNSGIHIKIFYDSVNKISANFRELNVQRHLLWCPKSHMPKKSGHYSYINLTNIYWAILISRPCCKYWESRNKGCALWSSSSIKETHNAQLNNIGLEKLKQEVSRAWRGKVLF